MLMLSEILIAVALLSLFPESSWRFLFKANHLFPFPLKMDPSDGEETCNYDPVHLSVSWFCVGRISPYWGLPYMEADGFEPNLLICAIMLGALARKRL